MVPLCDKYEIQLIILTWFMNCFIIQCVFYLRVYMINKINSIPNFSGIITFKTKKPIYLNFLDDVDSKIWSKEKNSNFKFVSVATSLPTDGYFKGVLLTGKDVTASVYKIENCKNEKIIKTAKDIFNIADFKDIKSQLKSWYKNFIKFV